MSLMSIGKKVRHCMLALLGLALVFASLAHAAEFGGYQIGDFRLAQNPTIINEPLHVKASGRAGLTSFRFVGRVGGVSFEAIADLSAFKASDLSIQYEPSAPDGSRAILSIKGKTFPLPLRDWQLKPIALYANSDYVAAVSLFGDGPDRERFFYITYHPALANTLIGLRLLQADILLIDPLQLRLPPRPIQGPEVGKPITQSGEPAFDEAKSLSAAKTLRDLLKDSDVQSWVLTDIAGTGTNAVSVKKGRLSIDVRPYYYFWRTKQGDTDLENREDLVKMYLEMEEAEQKGNQSKALQLRRLIQARISATQENAEVEPMQQITTKILGNANLLADANPSVFHTVNLVAKYRALFKGLKNAAPERWNEFIRTVNGVQITFTPLPNQWAR